MNAGVMVAPARVTYRFNGQQVAVREGVTLTLVHGDHLGSASLTTDISGAKVSELRYKPFGETRFTSGDTPTNKLFTSQQQEASIGLYSFGARFYDPQIGRFISADSIVPRPGDPQSLNRFAYTRNSPLVRVDPDGHSDTCNSALYNCGDYGSNDPYLTSPTPDVVPSVTNGNPYPYLTAASLPGSTISVYAEGYHWVKTHPYYNPFTDPNSVTSNWMGETINQPAFEDLRYALIQVLLDENRDAEAAQLHGATSAMMQASAGVVGSAVLIMGNSISYGWRPAIVYGSLQTIDNAANQYSHDLRTTAEVVRLAATGQYREFHLNQTLSTVTGGVVSSNLCPDIVGITYSGEYHIVEITSPSQRFRDQFSKAANIANSLTVNGLSAQGWAIL